MPLLCRALQVCIDVSFVSTGHVDVATFADLVSSTGGTLYSYAPFNPQLDFEQLLNDLRWNITRIQVGGVDLMSA